MKDSLECDDAWKQEKGSGAECGSLQKVNYKSLLDWKAGTVWESSTCIASELTAKKNANANPSLHYTLQTLHFLETEVKTVFGSAKTNRRFATDFSWQVHEVDKIISNVLGEGKNYYLLRAFFTWLIQTTFKYISFCVLHYSTSRSNSGQIWILFLSALIIDISFCNCKIPSSGGRLSHCPKILWKFFWKKKI